MGRGVFWLMHAHRGRRRADWPETDLDRDMMGRALSLAAEAARLREVPIGAVIYHSRTGAMIASARNARRQPADPAGHAEILAIRQAATVIGDWRLNEYTLAVTLEPCAMCAGAAVNARIGRLVYGAPDPKAGAVRSLMRIADDPRLNHRARIIPGVREPECAEMLRAFFHALRRGRKRRAE